MSRPSAVALEHEFADVLVRQQNYGVLFDTAGCDKLVGNLVADRAKLKSELVGGFAGWTEHYETEVKKIPKTKFIDFNPGSRDHITRFLKETYRWKPTVFTDGGKPQVSEAVLAKLKYPEADNFMRLFIVNKLLSTLSEGKAAYSKKVKSDGRIHGRVTASGTASSRCSHSSPNLGNVPSRAGPAIRRLFVAPVGGAIVGADAAGIQLRGLAHYLEPYDGGELIREILQGDLHTKFQHAWEADTRDTGKTCTYLWIFGGGPGLLAEELGIGLKRAKEMFKSFRATVTGIQDLVDSVGYLDPETKRRPRKSLLALDKRTLFIDSPHVALAILLQGFEAVIMKWACCLVDRWIKLNNKQEIVHQILMVHDEYQFECLDPDLAEELGAACVQAIITAGDTFSSRCPLDGDYKIGSTWADTH